MAVLGHVDCITFEGGIGEHNPDVVKACVDGLEEFGIIYDDSQYEDGKSQNGGCYGFSTIYIRESASRWRISYDTTSEFEYCHRCGSFTTGDHVCYDEYATDFEIISILTKILPDKDHWFEFRKAKEIKTMNCF